MKFILENYGLNVKVSIPANSGEGDKIAFANLAWVCGFAHDMLEDDICERGFFFTTWDKLRKGNRAFRIAKTAKAWHDKEISEGWACRPPRVRGKFLPSGFSFQRTAQAQSQSKTSAARFWAKAATQGNADYQNATDNPWVEFRSRLEA